MAIRTYAIALCIALTAAGIAYASAWNDSLTFDEVVYIAAGYTYLTEHDMRLNPEHPPVFKLLAALPITTISIDTSVLTTAHWKENINDQWEFGKKFLFESGNDHREITRISRAPMLIFFIASGLLLFYALRRSYGTIPGFIGLLFFSFSPTLLAHSKLVVNDVAVLWGTFTATYFFAAFLKQQTWRNALIAGVALGLALLTKFSSILLIPFFIILVSVFGIISYLTSTPPVQFRSIYVSVLKIKIIGCIAIFGVVYPVYTFVLYNYPAEMQKRDISAHLDGRLPVSSIEKVILHVADQPVLRPLSQYALGVSMNAIRSSGGNTFFFMGKVRTDATPWYFPTLYLTKETIPWLLFIALTWSAALVLYVQKAYTCREYVRSVQISAMRLASWMKNNFFEVSSVIWITLYGIISVAGNLNIGIRHILPLYPFILYITVACCIYVYRRSGIHTSPSKRKLCTAIVCVLVVWHVLDALSQHPHYLAYINTLGGGPAQGGSIATDSNIDWGQDMLRLSQFTETHAITHIEADIFTSAGPGAYLGSRFIPLYRSKYQSREDFRERSKTPWIAISESFIQDAWATQSGYEWLRDETPVAHIGYSIRVYYIPTTY